MTQELKAPMSIPPCPALDQSLIDHLKGVFPDKVPPTEKTPFEYGQIRGNQQTIEYLQKVLREQEASKGARNVLK